MVTERVELTVTAGRETEFERQFAVTGQLIRAAQGCQALTLARGVENPSKYLLLVEWQSVADHQAFTQTDGIVQFRDLLGPFFAAKPAMEHFSPGIRM
jgi:heme-degrading monooxygenase HmoA